MKLRTTISLELAVCMCLAQVPLASCGGGGGGGGGGPDGGGVAAPDCSDSADVSGSWQFTRILPEEDMAGCPEELLAEESYSLVLEQDGQSLTISGLWMEESGGSVCGTAVSINFGEDDGADWLHEEDWDLELANDGLTMTGTAVVTRSDNGISCTVSGSVSGVRTLPAIVEENIGTVLVMNDNRSTEALVFMRPLTQRSGRIVGLGVVPPGSAVVFPLPPNSWRVFTAYPGEDAYRFNLPNK